MNTVLQSFFLVFISEMGDKTQLLTLVLVLRYRQPWAIMGGILVATLLNHGLASWLGGRAAALVAPGVLAWVLALTFFAFAAWILVPDKDEGLEEKKDGAGAFWTTAVAFFLAEMGDKTQLATIALGARFASPWLVTAGTTLGMLAADGLAVAFGERLLQRIPMLWVRRAASLLFALFGVGILLRG